MPSEIRHIIFRTDEVVQAIEVYQKRTLKPLPTSTIRNCIAERIGESRAVRVRLVLAPDMPQRGKPPGATQEVIVEGPHLVAALIMFCQSKSVPLPAMAEKSLDLFDGQVCLIVAIKQKSRAQVA